MVVRNPYHINDKGIFFIKMIKIYNKQINSFIDEKENRNRLTSDSIFYKIDVEICKKIVKIT